VLRKENNDEVEKPMTNKKKLKCDL
jgi:hypothetical protein